MSQECVRTCPALLKALHESAYALDVGLKTKVANLYPPMWPVGLIGVDRLNRAMNSTERALFPTSPGIAPMNPKAAAALLGAYDRLGTCTGPQPGLRTVPRCFSRTRRAFGATDTREIPELSCPAGAAPTAGAVPSQCGEVQKHAAILTERLIKAAETDGLIPSVRKAIMSKIDAKALDYAKDSAEALRKELPQLAGDTRKLGEKAVLAADVMRYAGIAVKTVNIVGNSVGGFLYLRAAHSLDLLCRHITDADYTCPDATGTCTRPPAPTA
ncbi:hypothetical protein MTF65_01020 [Streptomyces sp. APSN-46.1]|uniref:hypothetical protein n=1 Tax=Streptomyces sp. APSN-46.1 TaxID=2929049 RepID=UPI001FB21C01|nr:hypothetical protein [Streptomyces sp. APSN-46.1]MCJ1675964.1 hypothetical protein [Streptomyces sp. APSN-46.1]